MQASGDRSFDPNQFAMLCTGLSRKQFLYFDEPSRTTKVQISIFFPDSD